MPNRFAVPTLPLNWPRCLNKPLLFIMKIFVAFLLMSFCFYCQGQDLPAPVKRPEIILKNFTEFWKYWNEYALLDRDYTALDESGKKIAQADFLQQLLSGHYLPLRLKSKEEAVFKLFRLGPGIDKDISITISDRSRIFLNHLNWEGKPLPDFAFTDLGGNAYNPKNTQGKVLVLKCWYIHCVRCVQEMPELNQLVEAYKKSKDVLFISLAKDQPEPLRSFLTIRDFYYTVIPDSDEYMSTSLQITEYPTHIIVDKSGKIVRMMNDAKDLNANLKKFLAN